jgi:probable HAF family extracellular repeat protein
MRIRISICLAAMMVLAATAISDRVSAQNQQAHQNQVQYNAFPLALDGGSAGIGTSLNDLGWVMGADNLPGDLTQVATVWLYGFKVPLGTLGGANSGLAWPNHNDKGEFVGFSETAMVDPLGESWSCFAFIPAIVPTFHQCLGFIWKDGRMKALPTLGGENGFGAAINNNGQAVGWAETTFQDPTCVSPQVLQFLAVIWEPNGEVKPLAPYPGDSDTAATAINDSGQVAGISGACDVAVGATSAKNAVMWENGKVINIGNFGSAGWNTPTSINRRGDVVGFMNVLPDTYTDGQLNPNFTAFLWTKEGGLVNLGTLEGDKYSSAWGINDVGQVVGQSYGGPNGPRAFIYQDGKMTNLNEMLPTGSTLSLLIGQDINDAGVITGQAFDSTTGLVPAYVALPVIGGAHGSESSSAETAGNAQRAVLPENVRNQLPQRWPFKQIVLKQPAQ